jgi:hypothetical protein
MEMTKEIMIDLLATNDEAVARALVVLKNNNSLNGKGFRPCHVRMGTSMANYYNQRGYLSPKQISYWRILDKNGNMKIAIYWKQLIEAGMEKEEKDT